MARRKTPVGCLFLAALFLFVLVLFLFNRSVIQRVLDNTDFLRIFAADSADSEKPVVVFKPLPDAEGLDQSSDTSAEERSVEIETTMDDSVQEDQTETENSLDVQENLVELRRIFFIVVDGAGEIQLKGVLRPVYQTESPLTKTIDTLLQGPAAAELSQGLISLIPPSARLNQVYVDHRTAFVDFSEGFRFNSFGIEGYDSQLKQVVFTATEFSTVDAVQILIDGDRLEFLGPEGLFIGNPLTRDSF